MDRFTSGLCLTQKRPSDNGYLFPGELDFEVYQAEATKVDLSDLARLAVGDAHG